MASREPHHRILPDLVFHSLGGRDKTLRGPHVPPSGTLGHSSEVRTEFSAYFEIHMGHGAGKFRGILVSAAWGIPLSLIIAFSIFLRKTLYPFTVAFQFVPKIALAPLFVTWYGFGLMPKFIIVFLLCFFPILLKAILGFTSLKKEHNDFALSTGADPLTVFWKVRLPAALPQIFVGLKWAAVNATVGATIGEWIGGDAGLGYYIQMASGDMKMDVAFAIIVMLAFLGLFLYYLVVVFEKMLVPWHVSQRSSVNGMMTMK